jgi:hypothetical protein
MNRYLNILKSIEEASEFWDTKNFGDYRNLTKEVNFETDIQRRDQTQYE